MAEKDFMQQAVEEYMGVDLDEPTPQDTPVPEPDVTPEPAVPEPKREEPKKPEPPQPAVISQDDLLREFNKLTGLNFDTFDKVKNFADTYQKIPQLEEQVNLIPELVDALDKVQNPMNYFRDETAFKVAMLSKDPKYTGKESLVNEILRSDLASLSDVRVIEMAASLNARQGVRNPLRAELRGMNIDPDEVLNDYESLDDDTKDLLKIRADQYRDQLPSIAGDIKSPSFEGTTVERLLGQKKAAKEDLEARMTRIRPIAENIVREVKELKMSDDYNYRLELTDKQVKEYTEELADIIASGQYDLSTDDGKSQVFGAVMSMIKTDHFDKAVAAFRSHLVSSTEEKLRREFNNEVPLKKNEPAPRTEEEENDLIDQAAQWLISQRS